MKDIGVKIREAAKKLGVTRAELAKKADLSVDTITNIVHGRSKKYDHLIRIADVLGLKLTDLEISNSCNAIHDGPEIDLPKYEQVTFLLNQTLHKKGIAIPKKLYDIVQDTAYNFSLKNNPSNQMLSLYITGMVDLGISMKNLPNNN